MKIKGDVVKQLDVGFLEVIDYPNWLANIVPVLKKMKQPECVWITVI